MGGKFLKVAWKKKAMPYEGEGSIKKKMVEFLTVE